MTRKGVDLRLELLPALKGGKGTTKVLNILEPEESHGTGRFFGISMIPVGGSIGKHTHEGDFEAYYILEGRARVDDNGEEYILGPGDMTHCKDGDYHAIENIGNCELKYVACILYSETKKPAKNMRHS